MTGFKTILVPVSDRETGAVPLEAACLIGRVFSSHVTALHVRNDPASAVPLVGEGMSGAMVEEMMAVAEQQATERALAARQLFDGICARQGVTTVGAQPAGEQLSAVWVDEVGREEEQVAWRGRLADLIVVGRPQPDRETPSLMTLNAALMESGRPLLLAPALTPAAIGQTVAIAWNGSAEAGRAVAAAMPFLHRAANVVILSVKEDGAHGPAGPSELANYLSWHGIRATPHVFTASGHTGDALLREAGAMGADLLVMGAYTHSRLRQLILGGVTKSVISHAAIPVMLCH